MLILLTGNPYEKIIDCTCDLPITFDALYARLIDVDGINIPISMDLSVELVTIADVAKIRYLFEISGIQDGLDKISIPISSFQSRRRSGESTYLQVVVPGIDYAGDIADRPNGLMSVIQAYEKDGEYLQKETIIETDIERIDIYDGSKSKSIILTGYKQVTFTPKTVTLTGSIYRSVVSGKIRHRFADPYIYLNPGDTLIVGTDEITVETMSYAISENVKSFEVEGA